MSPLIFSRDVSFNLMGQPTSWINKLSIEGKIAGVVLANSCFAVQQNMEGETKLAKVLHDTYEHSTYDYN